MAEDCNFCSPNGCNLGIQKFVKTAEGDLQDILQKFKNERQVDDQIVLSLGEGFRDEVPMLFQMGQGHFTDKFMEAADYLLERSLEQLKY